MKSPLRQGSFVCSVVDGGVLIEVEATHRLILPIAYIVSICQDVDNENPRYLTATEEKPLNSMIFDPDEGEASINNLMEELKAGKYKDSNLNEYIKNLDEKFTRISTECSFPEYIDNEWYINILKDNEWIRIPYTLLTKIKNEYI